MTYALFLQTAGARQEIAKDAGLPMGDLAVSGPFTRLTDPAKVATGPGARSTKAQDYDHRVVIDVANVRPVLTIHAQAPSSDEALRLVHSTITILGRHHAAQERLTNPARGVARRAAAARRSQ